MVTWKKAVLGLTGVAALAAGGAWFAFRGAAPGLSNSAEVGGEEAAFALMNCRARLLDGSPAIAVNFTQALDAKQDFGALLSATEGPAGAKVANTDAPATDASFKPVAARWVLGDNPRVLLGVQRLREIHGNGRRAIQQPGPAIHEREGRLLATDLGRVGQARRRAPEGEPCAASSQRRHTREPQDCFLPRDHAGPPSEWARV
jgi:hypothetical protein